MAEERDPVRNKRICDDYASGMAVPLLEKKYALKRLRIMQIVKKGGVWVAPVSSNRSDFLGISIDTPTKEQLKHRAKARGVSVSNLATDVLKKAMEEDPNGAE
jgi:hypothetical protein